MTREDQVPQREDHAPGRIDPVTGTVTEALAAAGVLDPDRSLYGAVDPDAINRLHRHASDRDATVEVTFVYGDHPVAVRVGRTVDVRVGRPVVDGIALRGSGVGN